MTTQCQRSDHSVSAVQAFAVFVFMLLLSGWHAQAGGAVTAEIVSAPTSVCPGSLSSVQVRIRFDGDDNDGPWQVLTLALRDDDIFPAYNTIRPVSNPFTISSQGIWYSYTFNNVDLSAYNDGGDGVELYVWAEVDDNDFNGYQPDGSSPIRQVNVGSVPTSPSGPSPVSGSTLTAQPTILNWADSSGATSYDVYLDGTFRANVAVSQWTLNQTLILGTHTWYVVARNSCGSITGPTWNFTMICPNPGTPSNPNPGNNTTVASQPAVLDWADTSGATSYDVYLDGTFRANVSVSQWTLNQTLSLTTHNWYVVARNGCGSTTGPTWSFTISCPLPAFPSSPNPANGATVSAAPTILNWSDTSGATSYDVYLDGTFRANVSVSQWTVNQTLTIGSHNWSIVAKNSCGSSPGPSPVWSFTISCPTLGTSSNPSPANGATVSSQPTILDWADTSGATSYDIYMDGSFRGNVSASQWTLNLTIFPGLHSWYVVAKNGCDSTTGPTWSFTLGSPPGTPSNPSPADGTALTVEPMKLDWANTSGATSYDVYLKLGSGAFNKVGADLLASEWTPNQSYNENLFSWYVVAKNAVGATQGPTWIYNLRTSTISGGASRSDYAPTPVFIQRYPEGTSAVIDPSLRTWIIIHGRVNSSTTPWVPDLADAISNAYPQDQILLLDWTDAAADDDPWTLPSEGEDWIVPVAVWAADKLKNYGFAGSDLNLMGHSWGGNMSAEIAERIPYIRGRTVNFVNTIVAFDPAENGLGSYNPEDTDADDGEREVDFARNSRLSWAFHSSDFGSGRTPVTAHETFGVFTDGTSTERHGKVIDIFAHMLRNPNAVSQRFTLARLLDTSNTRSLGPWRLDAYEIKLSLETIAVSGYEGALYAETPGGRIPQVLVYLNDSTGVEVREFVAGTAPEIAVFKGGIEITDGSTATSGVDGTDFGTAIQGQTAPQRVFTVANYGGSPLNLGPVLVPIGYTLTEALASTLAAGASDTFTVRLDTTTVGTKSGQISFSNNDSDEKPFNFSITGTVTGPPTISVTVRPSPAGRSFTVDGTTYTTAQTFSWVSGSSHSISTTSSQGGGEGIQYLWSGWSDGGSISHTVAPTSSTTYTANFTTQYYLTMNEGAGGNASPGSGWHNSGTIVPINASAINGYTFSSWTGSGAGSYSGSSSSASVTMNGPITETANFTSIPANISVTVRPNPSGRSFTVDGTTYTTAQTFSWVSGSTHSIATTSPQSGGEGIQYVWSGWSDGGAISHIVAPTSSTTYTANFGTEHFLTMTPGTGGEVSPGSAWHPSGTVVPINATAGDGYSFSRWTGSGSGSYSGNSSSASVTMNGPITETASFTALPSEYTYTINNGVITITGYNGSGGAVTVPSSINGLPVTSIGDYTFLNNTSLTGVTIPAGITTIGEFAFAGCESLNEVTIPNSLARIGNWAFRRCFSLVNVTIPSSVTAIGNGLFSYCTSLSSITIPNGVISIGHQAFADCTSLTSAVIPNSVTSIGDLAFNNCTSLSDIAIPNDVTSIGSQAFGYCISLVSLNIPDSVITIGEGIFYECTNLTSVTIGNSVTSIGNLTFYRCANLASISIPNSVTNIGRYAFGFCTSLTNVTIGNGVIGIGDLAFFGCASLFTLKVPENTTSIGVQAFFSCTSLEAITVDAFNLNYSSVAGVLFNKSHTALIQCPGGKTGSYTVPSSVTTIGDVAFAYCDRLTSITIPDSVASIGSQAFGDCTSLTSITIPSSVSSIENFTFNRCTSLTNVIIPESVVSIGEAAFGYCTSLTSATIGGRLATLGDLAFAYCYNLTGIYFRGDAPDIGSQVFDGDDNSTVYYLVGTAGWGPTFGGRPTALWNPSPEIPRQLTSMAMSNGAPRFVLNGPAGSNYLVQFSSNLVNWLPLSTHTISAGGSTLITDPSMRNQPRRFYRAMPHGSMDIIIPATAGALTAPFVIINDSIHQPVQTLTLNGGRAAYPFTIAAAGNYVVNGMVNAPNGATNSFFVNIDGEPQTPSMIWDIKPFTSGFEQRTVSWLGNGTTNSQFVPKVFNLGQGQHQLIIRGREAGVLLQSLTISPYP